jgi:hypothetical protein
MSDETANEKPLPYPKYLDGKIKKKRIAILLGSWANVIREKVYPRIPGLEVAKTLYGVEDEKSVKDVKSLMALMMFKEFFNLTDRHVLEYFACHGMYHHALHIDIPDDNNCYVSGRDFWEFKVKLREKKLEKLIIDLIMFGYDELNKVDPRFVGVDPVRFRTNVRLLFRGGIFFETTVAFLSALREENPEAFSSMDDKLVSKYLKEKTGQDLFGKMMPHERANLIKTLALDTLLLVRMFENDGKVSAMESYGRLLGVFDEQCVIKFASAEDCVRA